MDQNALKQIVDRLKEANNVLVTVSANPSVDQLSACIGFTILLNHLGKHGTAVFSGAIPSTIEFLKPDDTLEKNTDSLRDFIIALDKSKADKLRYKVEDKVVKIFITPYRTSISDKDLDFSQGDFNVDVVMALGVHERAELDKAIMDHGRILHDATVISVNNKDQGNLGAINWVDLGASSLSEMLVELAHGLTADSLDSQMATAFMTGIVAETDRFSNEKTSPRTMTLASELMSAGANQQLIASKLEASQPIPEATKTAKTDAKPTEAEDEDGSLQIAHEEDKPTETKKEPEPESEPEPEPVKKEEPKDEELNLPPIVPLESSTKLGSDSPTGMPSRQSMALEPPSLGGQLTANSQPEHLQSDVSIDPLGLPSLDNSTKPPILNRTADVASTPTTLSGIEESVASPHLDDANTAQAPEKSGEELEEARDAVNEAIAAEPPSTSSLDPIEALGAHPVDLKLRDDTPDAAPQSPLPSLSSAPTPVPGPEPVMSPAPASQSDSEQLTALPITLPGDPTNTPSQTPAASLPDSAFTPTPAPSVDTAAAPPLPAPDSNPFGAPPDMNGVNPNAGLSSSVPPSILPPSQPTDSTASNGNPTAPPPVPPPLMPPPDAI